MSAGDIERRGDFVCMNLPEDPTIEVRARIRTGEDPKMAAKRLIATLTGSLMSTAMGLSHDDPRRAEAYQAALKTLDVTP